MKVSKMVVLSVVLLIAALFAGCSSGSSGGGGTSDTGAFSMSVSWPDDSGRFTDKKAIPSGSSTITVSITGQWIDNAITSSISSGTTTLTISNVPVGYNVATIKAFNASGSVTAQRKEPFTVTEGQTTTCDRVPLGVAITGTTTSPYFEPSNINIPYGTYLYVQNWIEADYHCSVNLQEGAENLSLGAASSPLNGLAVYDSKCVMPREVCSFSLAENSAVNGTVKAPVTNYALLTQFGGIAGSGNGQFNVAVGAAVDSVGNIYVSEQNNHRVQKFDSSFNFLSVWGGPTSGTGDNQFNMPESIAVSPDGYIYVAECNNNRVKKMDSAGGFITKWGKSDCNYGSGNGEFHSPCGVAFDSSCNMYIGDLNNNRIQKFDSLGVFKSKWGSSGTGDGEFSGLRGIGIDSKGNAYTGGTDFRIQKFDSVGNFLSKWGSGEDQFAQYLSVSVDPYDNIFVLEGQKQRIQKFDSMGNYIGKINAIGNPYMCLAITPSGNLIVPSTVDPYVRIFVPAF